MEVWGFFSRPPSIAFESFSIFLLVVIALLEMETEISQRFYSVIG